MPTVPISREISQVQDGVHYAGKMVIAETVFIYNLEFRIPIPKTFEDEAPIQELSEVRRNYQIEIKKNGAVVELTDDEYNFFFQMLIEFAFNFYYLSRTRNFQVLDEKPHGFGVVSVLTGMTDNGLFDFPPKTYAMLGTPKFGCVSAIH